MTLFQSSMCLPSWAVYWTCVFLPEACAARRPKRYTEVAGSAQGVNLPHHGTTDIWKSDFLAEQKVKHTSS